jgi:hypothetical protein
VKGTPMFSSTLRLVNPACPKNLARTRTICVPTHNRQPRPDTRKEWALLPWVELGLGLLAMAVSCGSLWWFVATLCEGLRWVEWAYFHAPVPSPF